MNQISIEALEFVEEAKKMFTENDVMTTYRNEKEDFIALRGGFLDRSMTVYELGNPVGYFIEQLPSQHKELVDYDDYKKLEEYKKIKNSITIELMKLESRITLEDATWKNGYMAALLNTLEKF